jgi:hypothetical protein
MKENEENMQEMNDGGKLYGIWLIVIGKQKGFENRVKFRDKYKHINCWNWNGFINSSRNIYTLEYWVEKETDNLCSS